MQDEHPQLYLITPPVVEPAIFSQQLAQVLDGAQVACVRLSLASQDADVIRRTADILRPICHARDVPLVMAQHVHLAQAINYLEAWGMEIGLLINFGNTRLQFKRVMKPKKKLGI